MNDRSIEKARKPLSLKNSLALGKWMENQKKMGTWNNLTRNDICLAAIADLGFNVTPANLKHVAKVMEIDLPNKRASNTGTIAKHNASAIKICRLRRAVVALYNKLGEVVPEYLEWEDRAPAKAIIDSEHPNRNEEGE